MSTRDPEDLLIIELATGEIVIELFSDESPLHAERLKTLARAGEYDNVAFHRVLDGFVAQAGDVEFGDLEDGFVEALVGTGGSDLPDLPLELAGSGFTRGLVGMARGPAEDSANSQFFITLGDTFLSGLFTAVGQVVEGIELADDLLRVTTDPQTRQLVDPETGIPIDGEPDRMIEVTVAADGIGLGLTVDEAQEVALLYEGGLDRDGEIDLDGLNFWIDAREAGFTIEEVAEFFLVSTEFTDAYGAIDTLTDEEYVDRLYLNLLGREADEDGAEFWEGALATPGVDRADVLVAFAVSLENTESLDFVQGLTETLPSDWEFC